MKVNFGLYWTVTVREQSLFTEGGGPCERLIYIRPPQVRLRPPAAVNLHRRVEDDVLAARDGLVNDSQVCLGGAR